MWFFYVYVVGDVVRFFDFGFGIYVCIEYWDVVSC